MTAANANRESQEVNKELKGADKSTDLSHVSEQLHDIQKQDPKHWTKHLGQINSGVNMEKLGFPAGSHIAGLDGDGLKVTKGGKAVERDHGDGSTPPAADSGSGDGTHTVKKGENLSSIAREELKKGGADGNNPNSKDVQAEMKKIADANGITNYNHLKAGQELKIPGAPKPADAPPAASGDQAPPAAVAPEAEARQPKDVPGTRPGGTPDGLVDHMNDATSTVVNGKTKTETKTGELADQVGPAQVANGAVGWAGGEIFHGTKISETDTTKGGKLVEQQTHYGSAGNDGADGAHMTVNDGRGGQQQWDVKDSDTKIGKNGEQTTLKGKTEDNDLPWYERAVNGVSDFTGVSAAAKWLTGNDAKFHGSQGDSTATYQNGQLKTETTKYGAGHTADIADGYGGTKSVAVSERTISYDAKGHQHVKYKDANGNNIE